MVLPENGPSRTAAEQRGKGWTADEIERRFAEVERLSPDQIKRVDGTAIGSLAGQGITALVEGRRGLAVDPAVPPTPAIMDPEDAVEYVDLTLDNVIADGQPDGVAEPGSEEIALVDEYLDQGIDIPFKPRYGPVTYEPVFGEDPTGIGIKRLEAAAMEEIVTNPDGIYHTPTFRPNGETTVGDLPDPLVVESVSRLRERPGDQALPVKNESRFIQSMVIEDIGARLELGISRYGTGLQPFNGRSAGRDLYEEALDFVMYAKQVQIEHESMSTELKVAQDRLAVFEGTLADIRTVLFARNTDLRRRDRIMLVIENLDAHDESMQDLEV